MSGKLRLAALLNRIAVLDERGKRLDEVPQILGEMHLLFQFDEDFY